MKKVLILAALAVAAATTVYAGPAMTWGSQYAFTFTGAPDCAGPLGPTDWIPTDSSFLVEIREVGVPFDPMSPGAALWTAGAGFWSDFATTGVGYEGLSTPDAWLGKTVYTVVWNAASAAAATWYAPVGTNLLTWTVAPPQASLDYNFGGVKGGPAVVAQGDWLPVPEPGAVVLLAAAAGLLAVRRIRQRN